MQARRLKSWLVGFTKYTEPTGIPLLWRQWAALSAVSGALERRCTLRTVLGELAPNMYVLLVSPPGIGKSVVIGVVFDFWRRVPGLHLAPSSTTRAGLIDFMVDARAVDVSRQLPMVYHSVLCASPEFGNLVPQYDNAWLNILNDLYDCGPVFSDRTRKYGDITIEHPHLSILAGTQPKYLENLLPDAAFGMGFTSRLIMVYADTAKHVSLFSGVKKSKQLDEFLLEDLQSIAKLKGEFFLTPEAEDLFDVLDKEGFQPKPLHSKLQQYSARRRAHILKLMMCFSASERDDLKITEEHVQKSVDLLLETEKPMADIFQVMVTKNYADANEEALSYVYRAWMTNGKKPMQETALVKYLIGKVPNNQIRATIELMVQSGQLKLDINRTGGLPFKTYTPLRSPS